MFARLTLAFFLLLSSQVYAGDITRSVDFQDGQVLTAAQLDTSFDEIVNEVNDLDGDNLASNIAITSSGTFTLTGTMNHSGTFNLTGTSINFGNGGSDVITFNAGGGLIFTPAITWTFSSAQTVSGTWANIGTITTGDINGGTIDGVTIGGSSAGAGTFTTLNASGGGALTGTWTNLGAVTTVDINGGTMDGVQVGGTTATGELIVNDSNDDADGLGAQGTSGQYLKSQGAGVVPTWGDVEGLPYTDGSTYIEATATTLRTTTNTSLTKLKQFTPLLRTGAITVTAELSISGGGGSACARVYLNDVAQGSGETCQSGTTYVENTLVTNMTVAKDDVVQVYARTTDGSFSGRIQNVKIKTAKPTVPQEASGL